MGKDMFNFRRHDDTEYATINMEQHQVLWYTNNDVYIPPIVTQNQINAICVTPSKPTPRVRTLAPTHGTC